VCFVLVVSIGAYQKKLVMLMVFNPRY
jgi:hypothetical protein